MLLQMSYVVASSIDHDLYKTDNFFHINYYLKSVSKVALLHRFHCKIVTGEMFKYFCISS